MDRRGKEGTGKEGRKERDGKGREGIKGERRERKTTMNVGWLRA